MATGAAKRAYCGALSQALFEIAEAELVEQLKETGCTIKIPGGTGKAHEIPLLCHVDDLAVLADTPEQLQ